MELRLCDPCRQVVVGGTRCPACGGAVTLAEPERLLGESFGKYTLEAVVGAGGMGIVYRAVHRTLRRPVALKLLLPHDDDESFRRRFLREAQVLAEVKHPNVVEVYDFDVDRWGVPYVVMEYLEGTTLRDQIRRCGALPWRELAPVVADVTAGLASVHRRGIVHRDLKPENIFLARFDRRTVSKVLDFGIAKAVDGGPGDSRLTRSGLVVGTLNYLSPEQLLGEPVGPASDQYALALVVVEALTGRVVRSGKTMGRILSDEIRQPVELPPENEAGVASPLAAVIRRATAPDPGARFTDVEAFARALAAAGADQAEPPPTVARAAAEADPPTVASRPTDHRPAAPSRRWTVPLLGGLLVLAALAVGLWSLLPHHGAAPSAAGDASPPPLSMVQEIPLPVDAGALVAWSRGLLTAAGADGLIVIAPASGREPDRIGLDPADVLAATPDGELVLRRDGEAVVRQLAGNQTAAWADGLPATASAALHAAPDARWLAEETADGIAAWGVGEGTHYDRTWQQELPGRLRSVAVGTRLLAAAAGDRLLVWRLTDGERLVDREVDGSRVERLALHDDAGLVAYGGWSDRVTVLDVASGATTDIARRPGADRALALAFLYAGPTLAIGERGGVTLWRPGIGEIGRWDRDGSVVVDLLAGGGWLAALDRGTGRAVVLQVAGPAAAASYDVTDEAAWAIGVDPVGRRLLLGSADGTLSSLDLATGVAMPHRVHTLGITSLVAAGDRLATASDDRTIAVWRLPALTVEWRSRAHEFLVNQLRLDDAGTLWSTSSDGALKRWSWPELELEESVDTAELLGSRYALHAVWVAPDGRRAVLGTWNRAVLWLERDDHGTWQGRVLPFAADGGYAIVELPAARVLLLAGILHPYAVAALDLDTGALLRLPGAGHAVRALVATADGRGVLGFADSEVLRFDLVRAADGALQCTVAATAWPELGIASAATALPDGRVAVATDDGTVLVIDPAAFDGPPLGTFTLG